MAEGPMMLRPRKVVDYVCDDVDSATCVRKKEAEERKNMTIISMLFSSAIMDQNSYIKQEILRMTKLSKNIPDNYLSIASCSMLC